MMSKMNEGVAKMRVVGAYVVDAKTLILLLF